MASEVVSIVLESIARAARGISDLFDGAGTSGEFLGFSTGVNLGLVALGQFKTRLEKLQKDAQVEACAALANRLDKNKHQNVVDTCSAEAEALVEQWFKGLWRVIWWACWAGVLIGVGALYFGYRIGWYSIFLLLPGILYSIARWLVLLGVSLSARFWAHGILAHNKRADSLTPAEAKAVVDKCLDESNPAIARGIETNAAPPESNSVPAKKAPRNGGRKPNSRNK